MLQEMELLLLLQIIFLKKRDNILITKVIQKMKEKFLQYLWKNKVLTSVHLKDTEGNLIDILEFGVLNTDSGPDFHSAKIRSQGLVFFGNIEIHVKSSDWYRHRHQNQKEYHSIILHVVWEHDREIQELKNRNIPTLELKNYLDPSSISKMMREHFEFIPCEDVFGHTKIYFDFSKQIIFQKLEEKHKEIQELLKLTKNDYEAVLFQKIAYAFGLKINADIFLQIAQDIGFDIIKKNTQNSFYLECLLLGKAGLLDASNPDCLKWKTEYDFLKKKFRLSDTEISVKFFRLMPTSFPTIRLSQLSQLYASHRNLFSKIINANNTKEIKLVFQNIKTSKYWDNHFVFGKETNTKSKKLSSDFIDIILLNAIFPVIYSYHKENPNIENKMIDFYQSIKPEKNRIVTQWKSMGIAMKSALDSQTFLYLYKNYCNRKQCIIDCHQIK